MLCMYINVCICMPGEAADSSSHILEHSRCLPIAWSALRLPSHRQLSIGCFPATISIPTLDICVLKHVVVSLLCCVVLCCGECIFKMHLFFSCKYLKLFEIGPIFEFLLLRQYIV